jgi:hypothetical protein
MKRINLNLFPKDGYIFVDKDGTRLVAANWRGVIARVADYRKRNNLPVGNPEQEVHEQACERNPAYCSEITEQQKEMTRVASLKGRVLAWLSGVLAGREKQPITFLPESTVKARAEICATCPKNAAIADSCSSCRAALKAYRKNILGSRPINGRLNGCVILGEDTAVSTAVDQILSDDADLPAHCWRKAPKL